MNSEGIFNSEGIETIPLPKSIDLSKKANSELMLFLGAGASVPAKIPGVENMVYVFLRYLEDEHCSKYLRTIEDIISILREWAKKKDRKVDIELLLEAIEKLENRDDDTKNSLLQNITEVEVKELEAKIS